MNIRHLAYFIAVAEYGSVNAAAKALNVSQPAVSMAIRKLEEELGASLFLRDSRGMTLSTAGRTLVEPVKNVLASVSAIKNQNAQNTSVVRVISNRVISSFLTNNIFVSFMKSHRGVLISTYNDTLDNIFRCIRQYGIDIAVFAHGEEVSLDQKLQNFKYDTKYLFTDRRKLLLSASSPYAAKDVLTLDDLANINIFFYASAKDQLANYYGNLIKFANVYRVSSREDILNLVMHNEGGFFQPYCFFSMDERVKKGLLVARDIDVPGLNPNVNAFAMLCQEHPSRETLQLYDCILAFFDGLRRKTETD